MDLTQVLKKHFGFDTFRPLQQEVIETLMNNKDVLLLMPTGGGKSVCFQLPAQLKEGTALVISPLIALMKDQVEALKANGIAAAFLNSSLSSADAAAVRQQCKAGKLKLLYMAPETIVRQRDTLLHEIPVSMIAIDEAHCISSWGHDFRPEYTQLGFLKEKFPHVPVIALTATADKVTRNDIKRQLNLDHSSLFISSFDRPNLSLNVRAGVQGPRKIDEIAELIQRHKADSGIIYCLSRKNTEEVAERLVRRGVSCAAYHAGMESSERNRVQEAFRRDDIRVIVATIAFGMGIDKSNVRFVVHYNLPKNIESYYQEIGRAGRDGLPSDTVLYYSISDLILLRKFATDSGKPELNLSKLQQMQELAEAKICRRKILLNYFSESMTESCGNCDVCKNPPAYFDGTVAAQKAMSAMVRTGEKAGFHMIVNILRGAHNRELLEANYDKLKTYGSGREYSVEHWQALLMQMLQLGLIELAYDEEYSLKVTAFGHRVLKGLSPVHFARPEERERKPRGRKQETERAGSEPVIMDTETEIFQSLRDLRKIIADSEGIPPFLVFSDKTLRDMAAFQPATEDEMMEVSGVSQNKLERYGREFLQELGKYPQPARRANVVDATVALGAEALQSYVDEMRAKNIRLSHHTLGLVLTGSESYAQDSPETQLSFFGCLQGRARFARIRSKLKDYFDKHVYIDVRNQVEEFLAQPVYNRLSESARLTLAQTIAGTPLVRPTESLSETLQQIRKSFPRANEPWQQEEILAFQEAVAHTNDMDFLSGVFGRSPSSMRGAYEQVLKRQAAQTQAVEL